ncbi:hypothetical protein L3X38_003321 [Prunus dulcis]|uniref:GAG-pre-integrase domain-containing protein n=1 Tax=Prunus dulcis TaxID=3755 RepID=A0AAD4ZLU6_PRUDU|nr:hypothetical protein L3X38_003321 [Prunus dulcis]
MDDNSFVAAVAAAFGNLCGSDCIPGTGSNTWIIDTGASDHMTYDATFSFQDVKTCETIVHGKQIRGLYYLTLPSAPVRDRIVHTVQSCSVKDKQKIWFWHRRLGHPSFGYLKRLFTYLFRSCDESSFKCETCILAKSHRTVFSLSDSKAAKPFDLVLDFKTPLDVLCAHTSPVSVSKLPPKVFGCVAYVYVYSHQWSKLDPYAFHCVFIGYSTTQKGYKCYHPPTQKVHVTLEVTFHEEVLYYVSPSFPIQGEKGSKLESIGLQDLELRDMGEDDTNDDLREKMTGRPADSDRSHRSRVEEEALCLETTGRPDGHDRSRDPMLDDNTLCLETTNCPEDSDQPRDADLNTLWLETTGRLGQLILFHVFPAKTSLIQYPPLPCHCPSPIVILSQVS